MDSLPKLPKLNKAEFISSFVTTQQANAKSYAEEGRVVALTWQHGSDTNHLKGENSRSKVANFGFGTPILKPRKQPRKPLSTESPPVQTRSMKTSIVQDKKARKRQDVSDNVDKLTRLAERRTRKRVRREIVRPESPDASPKPNTKTKGSKSNVKGRGRRGIDEAPALALMHGFSASNVGKNRLTLKMNVNNLGVFNKGKASSKIHVERNKRKNIGLAFLEKQFLNKASTPSVNPKHSSRASALSNCTGQDSDSTSNTQTRSLMRQVDSDVLSGTPLDNDASQNASKVDTKLAGSEVWDIEIDGFELPSIVSESKEQKIDTCQAAWNLQMQHDELDNRGNTSSSPSLVRPNDGLKRPSSSIAPSQSASQCRPLRKSQSLTISKYFQFPSDWVHEAPQFHEMPIREQPLHSPLGNSTSHEELERDPPIKGILSSDIVQDSLALSNPAQSEFNYAPIAPVDEHGNSCSAVTPHFPDPDLSYLGYSVQQWVCSPGPSNNNKNLIDNAMLVDVDYDVFGCLDDIDGLDAGTEFNDQPHVFDDHGYPLHGDYCAGTGNEAQPEMWPSNEVEGCNWDEEDYSHEEGEDYPGNILEEGWHGETKYGINYGRSSGDMETGCGYQPGFYEGRELLLGLSDHSLKGAEMDYSMGLAAAEADVVLNMKSHWRPQRL